MNEKLIEIMNEIKEVESKIRLATPELQKVLFLLHKKRDCILKGKQTITPKPHSTELI